MTGIGWRHTSTRDGFPPARGIARLFLMTVGLLLPAVALGQARADVKPRSEAQKLLAVLCSMGEYQAEPVCTMQARLSPDDAWVVVSHACRSPKVPECHAFIQAQGPVLTFDVADDSWTALWESKLHPLKFDVAGTPTLRLKPGTAPDLKVVVNNISPLVYSAKAGTPKEEDLAVITGLKTFLTLAGTGLQGLVQTLAYRSASATDFVDLSRLAGRYDSLYAERADRPPGTGPVPPPPPCEVALPDVGPFLDVVNERVKLLTTLNGAMRNLEGELADLESSRASFLKTIQQVEDVGAVAVTFVPPDVQGVTDAFQAVDTAAGTLHLHTAVLDSCAPKLAAYIGLLGSPPKAPLVKEFASRVKVASCPLAPLDRAMATNAERLDAQCGGKLEEAIALQSAALKTVTERLFNAKHMEEKVWQATDKVRSSSREVLAGARTLNREVEDAKAHTWQGTLIRQIAVTRPNPELGWNKVQSHSVEIKADTPYANELTLAHATEQKHEYKLESATGQLLGFGIGMTYTPLYESRWTAVSVPGSDQKVIAETTRETRAGDLAAFVSYRFLEHRPANRRVVQPSLDFGVGITSDRPAFFLGVAAEVLRVSRIGVGWTAQRVSVLDETQGVGDRVAATDDIKTVKKFDTGRYYISVSFALDSLSLFNSN